MEIIQQFESLLYSVSRIFLVPVMLLIVAALLYSLFALGAFAMEAWQRKRGQFRSFILREGANSNSDDLELSIIKALDWLRIISRTAPMLGLIATMIPMGPALLALGQHDATAVGRNMVVAFSSVILALLAASISFFIFSFRRRWLLEDLRRVERAKEGA
ncbi:hypothetical protein AAEX37_02104 [Oligella sp. MSHR50489EDL]|uniref:MotA/TolQ/ExbB proton channel family protein n=1 Tax=Oligella sp. MSHR50489EDL TaxID=3139409 RepID=UPI003D8125CD